MDKYIQKSKELCDKLSSDQVPDKSNLEENCSTIQQKWKDTSKEVESRLQNLESQMVLWQQIEYDKDEIMAWAAEICRCLSDQINKFESKEKAEVILDRYKVNKRFNLLYLFYNANVKVFLYVIYQSH